MTNAQMIHEENSIKNDRLYIGIELSNSSWRLMFSNGFKNRQKTVEARDLESFKTEVERACRHFKMPEDVCIYSCYEAGRDGFWVDRFLKSIKVKNIVVDPSSMMVTRRQRRAKTDRIDAEKLVASLIRYHNGEAKVWSVVNVPSIEDEDFRRIKRELKQLQKEATGHTNRITSLLALHGIKKKVRSKFSEEIKNIVTWNGEKLPEHTLKQIMREYERFLFNRKQMDELKEERKDILKSGRSSQARQMLQLQELRGIGEEASWVLVPEYFGSRDFKNRKQVGACAGLTPTPYNSGGSSREQGIGKSGSHRVRVMAIEVAWYWLRYQPGSALTQWYMKKFGSGGPRMRKVGIVALARKLLIALWRYLTYGIVPEGAEFKAVR